MTFIKKKAHNWICSCGRKNDPQDSTCAFCQQPRVAEEPPARIKKKTAYDELHLWPVFSTFIRLRDSGPDGIGRCFTCGRVVHWKKADCGHGAGRQFKGTKYNEQNNHLQCKKCNGFEEPGKPKGRPAEYKAEMDKRYGVGTWDKMVVAARAVSKLDHVSIDLMTEYYEKEVERLLATKTEEGKRK